MSDKGAQEVAWVGRRLLQDWVAALVSGGMKAAATQAFTKAIADGLSQEEAKEVARKVRENWTTSPESILEPPDKLKPCGSCSRSLSRTSFSDKQWVNKKFRGEGRRCNSCLTGNALAFDPAFMATTVAAIASHVGNTAFPNDWAHAWQHVEDEMKQADANKVVQKDPNGIVHKDWYRGPTHQGRVLAELIRQLDDRGAPKAEKAAHRALAEQCWAVLSGRPVALPTQRSAPRAKPAVEAGWTGGAGLLATTDTGRGKAGRGVKALAAAELAAAVTQHFPLLSLGPDIATEAVFLPCREASGGETAVEGALAAIRAAGGAFAHVHRVWAVRETASTPTEAALTGHRMLEHALRDHPDATFAIRCKIDADVLDRP